jgi:excisionase family DNA binding protein
MKPGTTQFGMRENTASPRQHDSRVAMESVAAPSTRPSVALRDNSQVLPASSSRESPMRSPNNAAHTAGTGGEKRCDNTLLTVREVADLLHVPMSWVYGHIRERCVDRIPGFRLGKYWRFTEEDVTAWLRAKRTKDYHHAGDSR